MKPISPQLYSFFGLQPPAPSFERCSANDLKLSEAWLRDAIFALPELVIGPCRQAGLTDDDWFPWKKEFPTVVGPIDVLLVSRQGRLALVETKLASNPEMRRKVLAQALDYLAHLADEFSRSIPTIPVDSSGEPIADEDDVREAGAQGDVLVIIASDDIDPRVARLSHALLSNQLVKQWDLALVDLAFYRRPGDPTQGHVIVPTIRHAIVREPRQVVHVIVKGEHPRARVEVERVSEAESQPRLKWDERTFLAILDRPETPRYVAELSKKLIALAGTFADQVTLAWGTGRNGSLTLKRAGYGLIEVYSSGQLRFRPSRFDTALGKDAAERYRRELEALAPEAMRMEYPRIAASEAALLWQKVLAAVELAVRSAEADSGQQPSR